MNWFNGYKTNWFAGLIFVLICARLFWYYEYNLTFSQPPQSVHIWRQTNGLSMTQMYFQYHVPFFRPEIQNQISDEGLSGKTAGEFPVIYYITAKIWTIFGKSEWTFRFLQLLILFTGCFLLFRMFTPLTGNAISAGFISMLVITSPMIIFYGPNFLPDAPSLAFVFMAWFFLYKFVLKKKNYQLWLSAIFIFLAISLKITSATSFLAIGGWVILENLFLTEEKRVFKFRFTHFIPFIVAFIAVISWYLYVNYYTKVHHGQFSYLGIWPVWKMTSEQFHRIIDTLNKIYFREFFWPPLQYATVAIWIFLLFKFRQLSLFHRYLLITMPLGLFTILVLWFQVLEGHDYYLISQVQTLIVIWAIYFNYLKENKIFTHPLFLGGLVILFILLAENGSFNHLARYKGWMNEGYKLHMEALTTIGPSFREWNILPDDKVISIPDNSINASLYYMNRRGYTDFASDFSKEEIFVKRISQGAKYLIINDTTILEKPLVQKFATHFKGQYRNVKVFDLRPFENSENLRK